MHGNTEEMFQCFREVIILNNSFSVFLWLQGGKEIAENIHTLDLRPMPPFERHEKIFTLWGDLKTGEALKIINDHDPKPLWYQFEVEYKGKYSWEYEQKGPKDWIVKIKKVDK